MFSSSSYSLIHIWSTYIIAASCVFSQLELAAKPVTDVEQVTTLALKCQNLGLAYLEESQPQKAAEQFAKLINLLPEEAIGYGNLAVAQLRLKQSDDAWTTIQRGLKVNPMNSQLHFISAEILQLKGKFEQATVEIEEAVRLNPEDLEARYQLVRQHLRIRGDVGEQEKAIEGLKQIRLRTPTNIVVLMKLAQLAATRGDIDLTMEAGQQLKTLLADIPIDKLQFLIDGLTAIQDQQLNNHLQVANRNLRIFENINKNTPRYQQGIAELDTPILGHPIEDFETGFRSRLVTKITPPISVHFTTIQKHFDKPKTNNIQFDYDHDGDLDALELNSEKMKMWRNDGDGTFSDASQTTFGSDFQIAAIDGTFADFDDDGDVDLVTIDHTNCYFFENLRQGRLKATVIVSEQQLQSIDDGDYDNDGDIDLVITSHQAVQTYKNRGDGTFVIDQVLSFSNGLDCHFVDYDNDGFLDLWILNPTKHSIWRNNGYSQFNNQSDLLPPKTEYGEFGLTSDYDNDGDLDLVHFLDDEKSYVLQNDGGNQNQWLRIELEAIVEGNNKNNLKGIGSRLEVKAGSHYQLTYVDQQISHFGLGNNKLVDVARIVWTNGVPQNILQPRSNQKIVEKQVLKGSCPFLYVYDGDGFRFITDLLWKSPLGMITPIGTVASSKSADDYVLIGDKLKPKDGQYILKITEELWETAYFDQVKLITVDHPASNQIFVDEKFTPTPYPPFKIHPVKIARRPLSAIDHNKNDVLKKLNKFDYDYAVEHKPGRFQGVVDEHIIELDLGPTSDQTPIKLFLTGWIFPTDTSINVSISQNPAISSTFPYLQVLDQKGQWQTVINPIGIPAGKNKTMIIDLTDKFLSVDRRVRIISDMQVYWDRAFFTIGDQDFPMVITELEVETADLQYLGFPKMYRPTPHGPHLYDYNQIDRNQRWRDMEGFFTRYGDVTQLLNSLDDKLVVMNAGDEITVTFSKSKLPDLPAGWTRSFILFSDGWVKDADINTLASQTVGPLPYHNMKDYPPKEYPEHLLPYQLEYNSRRVRHKLPPF